MILTNEQIVFMIDEMLETLNCATACIESLHKRLELLEDMV